MEDIITKIASLNIDRGSKTWQQYRDKAQNDLCFADRKGYSIYSNTGDKMGAFPANAKKSADFQADVWFVASRKHGETRFEGVDDATKKLTPVTLGNDNSPAKIAEEEEQAMLERLNNLSIEDADTGSQRKDVSDDEDAALTVAEVAQAAAALADAVAAAVAEAGTDSGSPAVPQDDQAYEWLCAQLDTPCWRASTLADFTTDGRLPEPGVSEAT